MKYFISDRRKALLSMDKETIIAYMRKYNIPIPDNEDVFWISVHKARTGAKDLPMRERLKSHRWLKERNYKSLLGEV